MNKVQKAIKQRVESRKVQQNEWYSLRHMLGYANWALMYILLGGREAGKSYSVTNFFCRQWKNKGIPFTWMRLTERAAQKLLQNNAEKLIDPDLRRKYNLDLVTSGNNVYEVTKRTKPDKDGKTKVVEKKLMARVYAISTFYNDKGSIFDNEFLNDPMMRYNVAIDEFERESSEKNTFDILYCLVNQLENLLRSTKDRTKIFFLGNTLEEASELLCAIGFIPEEFGIFKIKSKRVVIENIQPTEAYKQRRAGTIADILMPRASTFTNKIDSDTTLITKQSLKKPTSVIKFSKDKSNWFTVWDGNIIAKFNGEKKPVIAMRPYLDEVYTPDNQRNIVNMFDTRCYKFRNLITFKQFEVQISLLKPRK